MAFSADSFKKAMGSPIKPAGGPMGATAGGDLDMDSLMKAPGSGGIEDTEMDMEGPMGEAGESSLEQALEGAGIQATPEQIAEIKGILGISGGMAPAMGAEDEAMGAPPAASKPTSKLDKLFSGK